MNRLGDWILDSASGPFGSNLKVECFVDDGFPIIDGANLKEVEVTDNITKFVTEEKARSLGRSIAKRHDVVVTISGTLGQISYIPLDSKYPEYLCSQRQFRVTFDESKVDVEYLVYYFHTTVGQKKILSFANYVGVPALAQPLPNFRAIQVDFPDLDTQHKVVKAIKSFDNLIKTNQRINRNLEELARLIYDYWFVQFDFPDKNSKPYKTCGGKMVYNDQLKREIPAGWEIKQICDIARFEKDSVRPSDNPKTLYKHFSIPSFDECGSYALELGESIFSDKFMISETDILVSKLNPWTSRVVWGETQENQICSTEFVVMKLNKLEEKGFLYSLVKQPSFIDYCTRGSSGTSHSHRRVNPEYMMDYIFAYNKDVVRKFSTTISQYAVMKMKNMREIRELAALRDQLLPLLMNGQISVENLP